ncbi:MAG TPA: hypothetical protein VKY26_06010 [Actinomycetota bacterium]|nr:hypothetical protein [Actinomycetota bacterium]
MDAYKSVLAPADDTSCEEEDRLELEAVVDSALDAPGGTTLGTLLQADQRILGAIRHLERAEQASPAPSPAHRSGAD